MKVGQFTSYLPLYAFSLTNLFVASSTIAQPIVPADDSVGTTINRQGNRFRIDGGSLSEDGRNLFHSFEKFGLESGQVANFLSNPSIRNILGRVTGGEVSVIQGLIKVTGGDSNLFLMNPAGMIFGSGASLNVPADFTATTATGIRFENNSFNAVGTNNYSNLVGTPSGYVFAVAQPGVILNEGNLTLSPGHNLTLLGGSVINTGQLSSPGGNIILAAIEGENLVRISQEGQLLNLEVSPLNSSSGSSTITPLSLPELLTGSQAIDATTVEVNEAGQVILTGSNTVINDGLGVAIASGKINTATEDLQVGDINVFGRLVNVVDIEKVEGNIFVLADHDIRVNDAIKTSGSVELKAGRNININSDIDTSSDNNSIIIRGNSDEANAANRSEGAASISQREGTILNAGKGNILIELGGLGEVGNINLADISTKGKVAVNANGGNINRVAEDSLIIGGKALFQTEEDGGIGTETEPVQIQVKNLEAEAGKGGMFFEASDSLIIGGVKDRSIGLATDQGGDINLNVNGDLTVEASLSTAVKTNINAGNITIKAKGSLDIENSIFSYSEQGNGGDITLKSQGDITITGYLNSVSYDQGNGGNVSLESNQGFINIQKGIFAYADKGKGNGGNITLKAEENIITHYIDSSSRTEGKSGNINVESEQGSINIQDNILAESNQGNGGDIVLKADDNITANYISSSAISQGNGGNIFLDSKQGYVNVKYEILSNSDQGKGNGGNITLKAQEDITTHYIGSIAASQGNGGNIYLESSKGSITVLEDVYSSAEKEGNGGDFNLKAYENIDVNYIDASSKNQGYGGDITIEATKGYINVKEAIFSNSRSANAGNVTLYAQGNILIDGIFSFSYSQGKGGNISLESAQGFIKAQNYIYAYAYQGNSGNITLKADGNIIASYIGSASITQGNSGNIRIETNQGFIKLENNIFSYSFKGNSGDITLLAHENLVTRDVFSIVDSKGTAGNIILKSSEGIIDTTQGNIVSSSSNGNSGSITLSAYNDITTSQVDTSSAFKLKLETDKSTDNLTPVIEFNNYLSEKAGISGDIIITSENGSINTAEGGLNSQSPGHSGNIILSANRNITTGSVTAATFNSSKDMQAGTIRITSSSGNINLTQALETFSRRGRAGNIFLTANGDIITAEINSNGYEQGGYIIIGNETTNKINLQRSIETYSEQGKAGNVNLLANDSIIIHGIRSEGAEQGGYLSINSLKSRITATGLLETYSEKGIAGNVNLAAHESITINGIRSEGAEQGGYLTLNTKNGGISVNEGNLETFSSQGTAGNITLSATDFVKTNDITSYGATESGNVTITGSRLSARNIQTQADNGPAGNITLGSYGVQGNIESANLFSVGNSLSGNIELKATDGSIRTQNIFSHSTNGKSGDIDIKASEDVTTGNIRTEGETGGGNINVESENSSVTVGNLESVARSGDTGKINVNASKDILTRFISSRGGRNSNDINLNSDKGSITTGDVESIALDGKPGGITITAEDDINTGDLTTVGTEGREEVALISETGDIYHGEINNGNPSSESVFINTNSDAAFIQNLTPILRNNTREINSLNHIINNQDSSINNKTSNSASNETPISPIPNSSQTLISPVTSLDSNVSTDGFTSNKSQSDLRLNMPVNTNNNLSLVNETGLLELEQNRTNEFESLFGDKLHYEPMNIVNAREVLTHIQQQTQTHSAVVYVTVQPQQLELVIFTAENQPQLYTLPISKEKFNQVKQEFVNGVTSPRLRQSSTYLKPAQQLYQWLIQPLESQLKAQKIDTLLFSMDSGLRSLPIAALHDGGQFLIEKYSLSLIPSISLMDTQYRALADASVLGMGASEFTELEALPAVPVELEVITQQLRQGKAFLNEEFTQANLIKQRQEYPYRIIHLATHTEFKPGDLENSFIQMWQDEKLYFNQLRQLKLNSPPVDLLVLSSCRTALGDEQAELGFAGLAVQAGVKSALASLWYVSDTGTLGLMTEFYAHLNQTAIKAEALRQAQIAMIRGQVSLEGGTLRGTYLADEKSPIQLTKAIQQDFSHPYYWSGFTMIGSPW